MDRRIVLLAHNIRSMWNVGSLFRTSDAFGVEKIVLSGYTATPPRKEIAKTALGAEEFVAWEHTNEPLEAIAALREAGYRIVALEQGDVAVDILTYAPPDRLCLILGHEVTGVPSEHLKEADDMVHIPMHGEKESLNVAVAAGVALHVLRNA